MLIKNSKFITSVSDFNKHFNTNNVPEIALVGRSNVGKSSLINYLCGANISRTSSTPGRTRLINYFSINNDELYFVDLPGYGYAKGKKYETNNWDNMLEPYLVNNVNLKCVCVLVDCRIEPTEMDKQMLVVLNYYNIPFIVIATKCDKLPKTKLLSIKLNISKALGLGRDNIILSSVEKNMGKNEIIQAIDNIII